MAISTQFIIIIGMAIVTYLPRMLPLVLLNQRELPEKLVRWMQFVPVGIFASLIFSDIFFWENQFNANLFVNLKLLPSLLVLFVAYKTKNILWSIIFGIIAISLMVWQFG